MMKIMRLKLFKNEDGADAMSMRLSCKKHDDHFLVVCACRAPTELCEVLLRCQVEFYMSLVCLGSLADLWKQRFHESFGQVQVLWIF